MNPLIPKKEDPSCKGLVFRAHVHSYVSSYKSIEVKKRLRLLKKKSCKGCEKCEWLWEEIANQISDGEIEDIAGDIKEGQAYYLKTVWNPGTHEYPLDGEMDLSFEPYEEPEEK